MISDTESEPSNNEMEPDKKFDKFDEFVAQTCSQSGWSTTKEEKLLLKGKGRDSFK